MATPVVVDASVVVKWFVRDADTPAAFELVQRAVAGEIDLNAPDLCIAESGNAIWKLSEKGKALSRRRARLAVERLASVPIRTTSNRPLLVSAYQLAVRAKITVYDGIYVALAQALDTHLVTADRRLVARLEAAKLGPLATMLNS